MALNPFGKAGKEQFLGIIILKSIDSVDATKSCWNLNILTSFSCKLRDKRPIHLITVY